MNQSHLTQAAEMLEQGRIEASLHSQQALEVAVTAAQDAPALQCLSCGAFQRPDRTLPCDH